MVAENIFESGEAWPALSDYVQSSIFQIEDVFNLTTGLSILKEIFAILFGAFKNRLDELNKTFCLYLNSQNSEVMSHTFSCCTELLLNLSKKEVKQFDNLLIEMLKAISFFLQNNQETNVN